MDHPVQLRFTPDGSALTFLHAGDGGNARSLWRLELADGTRRRIGVPPADATRAGGLSREEELNRQRRRESGLGLTTYRSSANADVITTVASGLCLVSRGGTQAVPLAGWAGVQDAVPSPDGARIAVVRKGDLWVVPHAGEALRLTDAAEPGRFDGLADYLAAEELDRFEGAWWSADGGALAWASVDERSVPELAISHLTAPDGGRGETPETERHRYPRAGGPNPSVRLMVRSLERDGQSHEVPVGIGDGYLARVLAHPGGGWLVAVLPRPQRSLHWWRVLPSGEAAELWEERSEPWLNLDEATRPLSDGRILRASEATGFRHLELRAPDGALERRLTAGEWVVTDLVHVDEARGEAIVVGTADGVTQRHAYAVPLDASRPVERPRRLTTEPGWHAVAVARDGARWADTWSSRQRAPSVVVRARDGGVVRSVHAPSASAASLGIVVPELRQVTAADGRTPLHAALFRPRRPAADPPPAVIWVYGGPHGQYVRESWELTVQPLRQALSDAGFAVVMVDGRGSADRGLPFEAPLAAGFGTVEVDDQAAAVAQLAAEDELDPTRVGITGWSYGGYMVIRCLARRPDVFRTGVAGAPVVDWTAYDTAYTERYLGNPADDPARYERASLLGDVTSIAGDLLVVHGTLDENVHPRHTEALVAALDAAGPVAEVLWLEGERHRPQSREAALRRDRRTIAHLCAALGVEPPPGVREADRGTGRDSGTGA